MNSNVLITLGLTLEGPWSIFGGKLGPKPIFGATLERQRVFFYSLNILLNKFKIFIKNYLISLLTVYLLIPLIFLTVSLKHQEYFRYIY